MLWRNDWERSLGLESLNLVPAPFSYEMWKVDSTKFDGHMTSQSTQLIFGKIVKS